MLSYFLAASLLYFIGVSGLVELVQLVDKGYYFEMPQKFIPDDPKGIKIMCISDTHNIWSADVTKLPTVDILIHSGDITFTGQPSELNRWNTWINEYVSDNPETHVIMTSGNHDLTLQTQRGQAQISNISNGHYLQHEAVNVKDISFFGSPWTVSGSGGPTYKAFQQDYSELPKTWRALDQYGIGELDVLITHGPAYGIGDFESGTNWGDQSLLDQIKNIKPKFHVFGHVHEAFGVYQLKDEGLDDTIFVNAAMLDKQYHSNHVKQKPIVFEV